MSRETTVTTTTDADIDALSFWGVETLDEPIRIVPFPCGRFVCDGHQYDTAAECESASGDGSRPQGVV